MKKLLVLATSAVVCASAFCTDLLIWNIDLGSNSKVENKEYTTISQFYIKSGDKVFDIADYTYTASSLDPSTKVNSDFAGNLGVSSLPGFNGLTPNMYTDWTTLSGDILNYTQETADTADYGAWEFFMQLENNGNMIGWSEHLYDPSNKNATALYLDAVVPGSVYSPNMMHPGATIIPFNFGSHLVPEPTSGLLMMLGAGLLALRRRRRRRA